jgi:hypothetical protein
MDFISEFIVLGYNCWWCVIDWSVDSESDNAIGCH